MVDIDNLFVPEIYLGPECNNRCLFCSVGEGTHPEKILADVMKELEILKKAASNVKLTGGEITVRPDLPEIVSYARELGFVNICIETNGRRFSDKDYAKRIIESGASNFFISIHGHKPDIHDRVTGVAGSFEETFRGIDNLVKLGQKNIDMNVVITSFNYSHLPEIIESLFNTGVNHATLSLVTVCGSAMLNKEIVPRISDAVPYIRKAVDRYNGMGKGNGISIGHVPMCFLKGYEKYSNFIRIPVKTRIVNPNFIITIESTLENTLLKGESCKECRFDEICYGLWKEYVNLYGFDELRPVPGKELKNPEDFVEEFR